VRRAYALRTSFLPKVQAFLLLGILCPRLKAWDKGEEVKLFHDC
jgi:hypothetical protein